MNLGERIRARRKELGWSLDVLAKNVQLSKTFLSELECGKRGIGADNLFRISQVIGIPADQLMGRNEDRQTSGVDVVLPGSLMRFASEADVSFRQALCLFWCARTINDHRKDRKRIDLDRWDWRKFHEAIKDFLLWRQQSTILSTCTPLSRRRITS